jgi:putative two-component system response regulator
MIEYESKTGSSFEDSLTGLFNHGFFQIYLDREIKRSERYGDPFTLVLLGLDSFNHYNKTHGSVAGDRVLKQIAGIISRTIRKVDLAARFSGDVIAVILTRSNAKAAALPTERIRQAVEASFNGKLTLSAGLASYPEDCTHKGKLLSKANQALLQAKIGGKNKICFFEKEVEPSNESSPRILVVDDEPRNVKLFEAYLKPLNYQIFTANNGEEALSIVKKVDLDLILLDIMMPIMDGYELCHYLKGSETTRLIPIVMVTALDDMESKIKAIEVGADDFLTKPPNKMELIARTKSLVKLKRLNNNLTSIENVIFSLAKAVEAKDAYTQGHVERVSSLAVSVGMRMKLSASELDALKLGGALHDIGKIAVSRDILNKPWPLDSTEWEIMKRHTEVGHNICLPLKKNLGLALSVIRHHHEKLDGSGYPDGLTGDEIPTVAQIMAVVDIYDALITDRPYRNGMESKRAFEILHDEAEQNKLNKKIVENLAEIFEGGINHEDPK